MRKILRDYQQDVVNRIKYSLKNNTHPLLATLSVGAGKSVIIAEILLWLEHKNYRALCLTLNSTLIQQNHDTYKIQGGNPGIYCSGLKSKNHSANVIFASPHSIEIGIKNKNPISEQRFNLIIVDECHNVSMDEKTMFRRIFNHYGFMAQQFQYSYRILGLTGTPFRFKGEAIVGPKQFFKEEVCNIKTHWLIERGFLVPAIFGHKNVDSFDMSSLRVDKKGKFKHDELQKIIDKQSRLTEKIIYEIVNIVESGRNGAFIFASTIKHAEECIKALPQEKSACITGDTPHEQRKKILDAARNGTIKYLVNVATLLVGVDVPNFDTVCWLRPTESLVIYTQGIGRVLRLFPGKLSGLVLDYAMNAQRHGDIDDPIINAAIQPLKGDIDYVIPCHDCGTLNSVFGRRCIGLVGGRRCEHFFEFRECSSCRTKNDIVARSCRNCGIELIDPNKKLHMNAPKEKISLKVIKVRYWANMSAYSHHPIIHVKYRCQHASQTEDEFTDVYEVFYTNTPLAKNIFWGNFIKQHFADTTDFYSRLTNLSFIMEILRSEELLTPNEIICVLGKNGKLKISKKMFYAQG